MKKSRVATIILRLIALLGIMGVGGFYIQISQWHLPELKQVISLLIFLFLIILLSIIFLRRELTSLIRNIDLLIPLCFLITITEIVRFNFQITKEIEALNINLVRGHLTYIPLSPLELGGVGLFLFTEILCTAWLYQLIWQVVEGKKINLVGGLSKINRDWFLVFLGMGMGFGVIFFLLLSISTLTDNVYLFSAVLGILCLIFNLISAPLIPILLKYNENILNKIKLSFSIGLKKWKLWFLPIFLLTLIMGISIGFPTNFFELLSLDSSLLTESRFFWSINDLWLGGVPNSFQWYPTLVNLLNSYPFSPFYIYFSAVVSVFSILVNLRIVYVLQRIIDGEEK